MGVYLHSDVSNSVVIYKNGSSNTRVFSTNSAGSSGSSTTSLRLADGDYIHVQRDVGTSTVGYGFIVITRTGN